MNDEVDVVSRPEKRSFWTWTKAKWFILIVFIIVAAVASYIDELNTQIYFSDPQPNDIVIYKMADDPDSETPITGLLIVEVSSDAVVFIHSAYEYNKVLAAKKVFEKKDLSKYFQPQARDQMSLEAFNALDVQHIIRPD